MDEDGDTVEVSAGSFSQTLVIMHKPKLFFPAGAAGRRRYHQGGARRRWRRRDARREHDRRPGSAPAVGGRPIRGDPGAMMAMPLGPLMSILFSAGFMLMLARFQPQLAVFAVLLAGASAFVIVFYKGRYFPRWIMDVLDRLTDRASLEKAYEARGRKLVTIDAVQLAQTLKGRVIGQDATIDAMAAQLRRRLAAQRPDKPVAVFCLAGPPGVGKTHLAKMLAETLYADKGHLHFFDMSQFGQPHAAASLFGQARGYVGSTSYGALTSALRDTPDSVVLLDEFEKAHPEVHKRFLTAWNDGFVTEVSDGAKIPTTEAIFVLTTNAASRRHRRDRARPGRRPGGNGPADQASPRRRAVRAGSALAHRQRIRIPPARRARHHARGSRSKSKASAGSSA